eukprot:1147862-Pelagomonas_calceolata.AAC.4
MEQQPAPSTQLTRSFPWALDNSATDAMEAAACRSNFVKCERALFMPCHSGWLIDEKHGHALHAPCKVSFLNWLDQHTHPALCDRNPETGYASCSMR